MAAEIDLRNESSALRRVSLLLDRLRQDGFAIDPDLAGVRSRVDALRCAAVEGRKVQRNALNDLAATIAMRLPLLPARSRSMDEMLRSSVYIETDELLRRLAKCVPE